MKRKYAITIVPITGSYPFTHGTALKPPDDEHEWEVHKMSATSNQHDRIHYMMIVWKEHGDSDAMILEAFQRALSES